MNFEGILIGIVTFLCIGLFHPIVIKAEYYWSKRCWWLFALAGVAFAVGSCFVNNFTASTILGVLSCASFWSILELFEQEKRVEKGWFPRNPKRKK